VKSTAVDPQWSFGAIGYDGKPCPISAIDFDDAAAPYRDAKEFPVARAGAWSAGEPSGSSTCHSGMRDGMPYVLPASKPAVWQNTFGLR
jgi:hypothetical protein